MYVTSFSSIPCYSNVKSVFRIEVPEPYVCNGSCPSSEELLCVLRILIVFIDTLVAKFNQQRIYMKEENCDTLCANMDILKTRLDAC